MLGLYAHTSAQKVTLDLKSSTLMGALLQVTKQTGYTFVYKDEDLYRSKPVTLKADGVEVDKVMPLILKGQNLGFKIKGRTIAIVAEVAPVSESHRAKQADQNSITVSGKVTDSLGNPLAGVAIISLNTTNSTQSNKDGSYELKGLQLNSIIQFRMLGYYTAEIAVSKSVHNVILKVQSTEITNVDVVFDAGYQTISKARVTGAFGQVQRDILSKRPVYNLADAIQGQMAGVVADPNTGFVIRGRSTLSSNIGDLKPLIVVDGLPIEGGFETINPNDVVSVDVLKDAAASSIYGARAANGVIVVTTRRVQGGDRLDVNYNSYFTTGSYTDIDHYMNFISSKQQIDLEDYFYKEFKGTTTIRDPWLSPNFRGRFGEYFTLLAEHDKGNISMEQFDAKREVFLNNSYKQDYLDYVLRRPFIQQQNLSFSGNSKKNNYKISLLYDNDKTHLQRNNNTRTMVSASNQMRITDKITYNFNTNISFFNKQNNGVNLDYAKSVTSPWTRVYDNNGEFARHINSYYEPAAVAFESQLPHSFRYNFYEESLLRDDSYKGVDIRIQNGMEFKVNSDLSIKPNMLYEYFRDDNIIVYDEQSNAVRNASNLMSVKNNQTNKFTSQIPGGGFYFYNAGSERKSLKFRLQGDYNKTFGNSHVVSAIGGAEVISSALQVNPQDLKYGYSKENRNFALFDYNLSRTNIWGENISSNPPSYEGRSVGSPYSFSRQSTLYNERYFAAYLNGSYTFDGRYVATASLRSDASNYISRNNKERFSPFFSVGGRWNIARESFLRNSTVISDLSLRLTYGSAGNAAGKSNVLPFSVFLAQPPNGETGNYPGGAISGRQNDLLTWEKTYSTNLGLDFGLFNNKLFGSVDFYNRNSQDLLTLVQTSNVIWSSLSQTINAAKVLNRGIEASIGTNIDIADGLKWSANMVFDYNYNKVLEYNYLATRLTNYVGGSTFIEGLPTDRIMAVKFVGTTPEGYYVQQRKSGELVPELNSNYSFAGFGTIGNTIPGLPITADDRIYYMGRTTPPATLGFTNRFNYKGLELMFVITGRFGHLVRRTDTYLMMAQGAMSYSATGFNILQTVDNSSSYTGNVMPTLENRLTFANAANTRAFNSDVALEQASHLRLNEVYLAYDLLKLFGNKRPIVFKSAAIYTQLKNLGILWTNNESKIDPSFLPGTLKPSKLYTFGLRLGI